MANYTFAAGVPEHGVAICKLVTGELIIGKITLTLEEIEDVALIMPREVKQEGENKFGFYTVPYGYPMTQKIIGETINLAHVIKIFSPLGGFEDVLKMYTKITEKEREQDNG